MSSDWCRTERQRKKTTTYLQGFVIPAKTENKQTYLKMAKKAVSIFSEYGTTRTVECWGDELMTDNVTDFKRAVRASDDKAVVFS